MSDDAQAGGVTVVIPSCNRAHTLPRALDSVLAQTLPAAEIIVVDDGSTDTTLTLLAERYPAVRCLRHARPRGVSAARNAGIAAARHDWIALLDSDDAWESNKLTRQMALARPDPGYRLVHCDERWLRRGQPLAQRRYHAKRGGEIFFDCLPRCVISPSAALLHRSLLNSTGGFDEDLPACEDYDLWLRICAREPVAFVAEPLVIKHGGHADQLSRTVPALDRFRIQALVKLLTTTSLTPEQRHAARAMLRLKRDIFVAGARKRGRDTVADTLTALCQGVLRDLA